MNCLCNGDGADKIGCLGQTDVCPVKLDMSGLRVVSGMAKDLIQTNPFPCAFQGRSHRNLRELLKIGQVQRKGLCNSSVYRQAPGSLINLRSRQMLANKKDVLWCNPAVKIMKRRFQIFRVIIMDEEAFLSWHSHGFIKLLR